MNVRLTKWFLSAAVLAVMLVLAVPSTSCGLSCGPVLLVDDPNQPQPECVPFESGAVYLEGEPNQPGPEFLPGLDAPAPLDADPNAPQPESYRC